MIPLRFGAGSVWAYIDPTTGGTVFSAAGPILAGIGVFLLAGCTYARAYLLAAARAAWRLRAWMIPALAAVGAGLACPLLLK